MQKLYKNVENSYKTFVYCNYYVTFQVEFVSNKTDVAFKAKL